MNPFPTITTLHKSLYIYIYISIYLKFPLGFPAPSPAMLLRHSLSYRAQRRSLQRVPFHRCMSSEATGSTPTLKDVPRRTGKRVFDPNAILPSERGHVRVISNTTRDAQQSNLSAEMSDAHRQEVGRMINACFEGVVGPPGYEQTWGGTVPMFDLWKRGVQPFTSLRNMTKNLPDTPVSALIRSNGLNAMANQPKDVVDAFIGHAAEAGVDVFTNFDAHNDWRNHVAVAEAVHKYGGHFQAALSYAVFAPDPTVYNVQWAVDFFKEMVALGAHSLYVKDPSGVLTPEIAGVLAAAIKEAFPDKPLVFHTHYQTGYGYMSYLEAVKNGANGVECSLGFPDGAGQPYALSMLRTFEDFGFSTGEPNKDAMQAIADRCKEIRSLYPQGRVVRTPDIRIERTGVAGGQRSILDKELSDAGQADLISKVDEEVQRVRVEGGIVCQVTPVADSYVREAMRRIRGGAKDANFAPGFAAILVGEGGLVKEPVDSYLQRQALLGRARAKATKLLNEGKVGAEFKAALLLDTNLAAFVDAMQALAEPTTLAQRLDQVMLRISQLERIDKNKKQKESLNRKIVRAGTIGKQGKKMKTVKDYIKQLQAEKAELDAAINKVKTKDLIASTEEYEAFLRSNPSPALLKAVVGAYPEINALVENGVLNEESLVSLLSSSGVVTCCAAELLPPGLPAAAEALVKAQREHFLSFTDEEYDELVVLMATYREAAIPRLMQDFLLNYKENPSFWAPLHDADPNITNVEAAVASLSAPPKTSRFVKREVHKLALNAIGADIYKELVKTQRELNKLENRQEKVTLPATIEMLLEERIQQTNKKLEALYAEAEARLVASIRVHKTNFVGRVPTIHGPRKITDDAAYAIHLVKEAVGTAALQKAK